MTTGTSNPSPRDNGRPLGAGPLLDEELTGPLGGIVENLESTLREPLKWEAGALLTAAMVLERAEERLLDIERRLEGRLHSLRQARAYLTRKADALRSAGREALPAEGEPKV